jgi:hypothetical protein
MKWTVCKTLLISVLTLAACGAPNVSMNGAQAVVPARVLAPPAPPAELLYVLGGAQSSLHPSIDVFNGEAKSNQKPIYKIAARGSGQYGLLVVDANNDLYAINYFYNAAELDVFPSGKRKPTISCALDTRPYGAYIAGAVLFLTTAQFTVEEYSLPLQAGTSCPSPTATLTDQRAKLRAKFFLAVAVDPSSDVFDVWQSGAGQGNQHIDEFIGGMQPARPYARLGPSAAFYMASDSKGNLVTNITPTGVGQGDDIAIFRHGSHRPKLYDPISNGSWLGFAFAKHDTELFAAKDYPTITVEVYSYDSAHGRVGALLRSFSTGIWFYDQSIAVYSKM